MATLAAEHAKNRQVENVTETGELVLIQALLSNVTADDFYQVKSLKIWMSAAFEEEQKWISTHWIGRALRRLGFKEKRRIGTGYEYRLTGKEVREVARRMNVAIPPEPLTPKEEEKNVDSKQRTLGDTAVSYSLEVHEELVKRLERRFDVDGKLDREAFAADCQEVGQPLDVILKRFCDIGVLFDPGDGKLRRGRT
jgi:hypothetical protein